MIRVAGALATALLVALTIGIGVDLFVRGAAGFRPGYLVREPRDLGRGGGIGPVLVSTGIVVGAATLLATALSLPAAVFITEMRRPAWFGRFSHIVLNIGIGVPRIVWGLFGAALFGGVLGFGFSVATGVLTLACLMAPIMTAGFISGLSAVDPALTEQCRALGTSRWATVWRQIVPAARPALTATAALAAGRGLGDAAALLFTSGVAASIPHSCFDSAATLAVYIFHLLTSVPGGQQAAYAAAALLFALAALVQLAVSWAQGEQRFAG